MKGKMMMAGILAAVIAISGMAVMVMAQTVDDGTMEEDEIEQHELTAGEQADPAGQYLLTAEQTEAMKVKAQELRDAHATRTEIRETVQTMAHEYVQANLESYGLTSEDIEPIQAKMTEIMEKMLEVRETAYELRGQDMNRQDIRTELQPLMDEAKALRQELKDMLDRYGILPPEIQQPGMGAGCGEGQGDGRLGRRRPRP